MLPIPPCSKPSSRATRCASCPTGSTASSRSRRSKKPSENRTGQGTVTTACRPLGAPARNEVTRRSEKGARHTGHKRNSRNRLLHLPQIVAPPKSEKSHFQPPQRSAKCTNDE